ncbi:MAG: sel1 repeat family protein [Candidatus Methanomethylophilaceae archaeon]|nr:sel1 repeat family protein [Candidatus Methanomethylophilaceae archaeon]
MGDDLWLKANAVRNGYPTVLAALNHPLRYIDGSQESALWRANKGMGDNDVQLRNIDEFYSKEDLAPTERIRRSCREPYIRCSVLVDCREGVNLDDVIGLRLSLDKDMEIICYDVKCDDFSQMFSKLSMRPSTKVLPLGEKRMPLHAIATIANGDLAVCVEASEIKGLKPEELELVSEQGLDVLSGDSEEAVFTRSRTVLDRRNLADSWIPSLDDGLSKRVLLKKPFEMTSSDVIPGHYSSSALRRISSRCRGLVSCGPGLEGVAEIVADAITKGSDASGLDPECIFDDSPFARTRHQCPICGSFVDAFAPAGARMRDNALCRKCGSLERHRGLFRLGSLPGVGAASPRVLCVNFPGSMNPIVRGYGVETTNLSKHLRTDRKYDVVLYAAQMKNNPDIISTMILLKGYVSDNGRLIVTFNVKKDARSIGVADAPYDVFEMCSLLHGIGFGTRITWYREAFSSKSLDFSSLNVGEMALECTPSSSVTDEISSERAEEIAEWHVSKKDEKNLRAASSWYEVAGKKDEALDILWEIGSSSSCKEMIEKCGDDPHSLYLIGKAKQKGLGTTKNLQEAIDLFRRSADPASEAELCATLTYTRRPEDLKEALGMGDTSEDPAVALYVARMHKEGKYVPADIQEYARLLRRSYSLGGEEAGVELLSAIRDGALPLDEGLLGTAELDENPAVRIALSRLYSDGKTVPKDLGKAADILGPSNDMGAREELLRVLWEQNDPSSYDLLVSTASSLAEKGDGIAMNALGRAYRYGRGV